MSDDVMVRFDWDSGIVYMWSEAPPGTPVDVKGRYPNGGAGPVLPVPRELWERYARAQEELAAAEEALEEARKAAQKVHA